MTDPSAHPPSSVAPGEQMTIRFFFPYRSPSGVCSAFAHVAESLASHHSVKVAVLDYKDGYLRRSLDGAGHVILEDFADETGVTIPAGDVLVLQASPPYSFRRELAFHAGSRLVLWQLHPLNFIPSLIPLLPNGAWVVRHPGVYRMLLTAFRGAKRRRLLEFVSLLGRKRALFFYDQPSVLMTERLLGCRIPDPILLPVPVDVPAAPVRRARLSRDRLSVAWVGRLYDFKINILAHTLRRFSDYAREREMSMTFHVIGDGPERRRLDRMKVEHRFFHVQKTGDLNPHLLGGYLASNVDLVAAMGTSALEAAVVGLPTILLDYSYGPVGPGYRFRWLHDTKGYDLGHAITADDCDPGKDGLPEMIEAVAEDYSDLAEKCFDYCAKNHSMRSVGDKFVELVRSSALRFGDINDVLLRKNLPRRIYERTRRPAGTEKS